MAILPQELGEAARQYRAAVDAALDRYTQFADGCPPHLGEAIRYSLLAPGKRLRPTLVMMAAAACGGDAQRALPAACAVEMIHAYSLIHDDLPAMDDDDLRRGRPSCHVAHGEATAILAGDALIPLAFETLTRLEPAEVAARCCYELARAAGATMLVGGQADDLLPDIQRSSVDQLETIHHRKTGALFRVSLRLGAVVVQAADEQIDQLDAYGRHLGLAFQITDDLLDYTGSEAELGKRTGKDADRGKITFPGLLGADESRRRAEREVNAAITSIAAMGKKSAGLEALARFVLDRNQ